MKMRPSPNSSPFSRRILFLGEFAHSSIKPILSGVLRFLSGHPEMTLLIHEVQRDEDASTYGPDTDADGIISCLGSHESCVRALAARKKRLPFSFVCAQCNLPSLRRRAVSFSCDDHALAEMAAALLMRHGLAEFGFVGAGRDAELLAWNISRREAFVKALGAGGFSAHVYEAPDRSGSRTEFAALAVWLRALPKPCGLFVSCDQRAMHVLNICRAERIAVPEQIQIVGADNETWICDSISPTLSSIELDFEGAGFRAAEALLAMMDGSPCGGREETFGVRRVVERMSTTDTHGSASRAVRAREWIRRHAGEPLTVAQLARKMCCSVRTLQTSYRTVFGTTVWEDIAEARLEKARRLLKETKTPVGEIAQLVGFESSHHFAHYFKARTGMSMRDWRHAGMTACSHPGSEMNKN